MNKKGFTLIELILSITIIAIIISVIIPISQYFLTRAKILDANLKAKTVADVVNRYLLEQELAGNGMSRNGKYCYIAIAAGDEPIVFDENFNVKEYATIKVKNDYVTDTLTETLIINSIWGNRSYPHHIEITKTLDKAFNGLRSCFIIAVISENKVVQVFYIPDIANLGFDANYREVVKFFTAHCVIKGKIENIASDLEQDMGTVFYVKEGVIRDGRLTISEYEGVVVGAYPVI